MHNIPCFFARFTSPSRFYWLSGSAHKHWGGTDVEIKDLHKEFLPDVHEHSVFDRVKVYYLHSVECCDAENDMFN